MYIAKITIYGSDKIFVVPVKSLDIDDVYDAINFDYHCEFWTLDTKKIELDTDYTIYNHEDADEDTPIEDLPEEGELYITDSVIEIN